MAGHPRILASPWRGAVLLMRRAYELANWSEADASFRMHSTSVPVSAAHCPAAEQLTIGRAGVLSSRAVTAGELEALLSLLGPPSERQRSDLKQVTDIVLIEDGHLIYWPRTCEQFADAA